MLKYGQKGREIMNIDEKLDLILNKLSEIDKRVQKVEDKEIKVKIIPDPIKEKKADDNRYYWKLGVLSVFGFVVLFNVILFIFDLNGDPSKYRSNQLVSFFFALVITGTFAYTIVMNRKERK